MCYACEACVGSELSLFEQTQSVRESVLMTRRLVGIRSKFRWYNSDVFHCTILLYVHFLNFLLCFIPFYLLFYISYILRMRLQMIQQMTLSTTSSIAPEDARPTVILGTAQPTAILGTAKR
jgi:hypothetical protein